MMVYDEAEMLNKIMFPVSVAILFAIKIYSNSVHCLPMLFLFFLTIQSKRHVDCIAKPTTANKLVVSSTTRPCIDHPNTLLGDITIIGTVVLCLAGHCS